MGSRELEIVFILAFQFTLISLQCKTRGRLVHRLSQPSTSFVSLYPLLKSQRPRKTTNNALENNKKCVRKTKIIHLQIVTTQLYQSACNSYLYQLEPKVSCYATARKNNSLTNCPRDNHFVSPLRKITKELKLEILPFSVHDDLNTITDK